MYHLKHMLHQTWNTENKNRETKNKLRNYTRSMLYICVPFFMLIYKVATFKTTKSWLLVLAFRSWLQGEVCCSLPFLEPCYALTIRYFKQQFYMANHGLYINIFFFSLKSAHFNSRSKAVIEAISRPMQPSFDMSPENCSPLFPPVNDPPSVSTHLLLSFWFQWTLFWATVF